MPPQTTLVAFSTNRRPLVAKYKSKVAEGIKDAASKCKLTLDSVDVDLSDHEFLGKHSTRFGNRPMDASTSGNYESHLRQFWRYAAMLGDYESMLMLLKKPPLHCPSMSVRTIESFLRFKRLHPNEPLLDIVDNPILDVFNTPMTADGSWNAPKNVDIYRAAVHDIHIANGHTVAYEEACSDCRAVPEATRHQGCEHHLGHPRLYRCGAAIRHATLNLQTQ
jgi:hypothetical protein